MNGQPAQSQGQKFSSQLVNQQPVYDRVLKIKRPRKKKGKGVRWI